MHRKAAVVEIKFTRFDVCTDIEEIDNANKTIGQAFHLLTDYGTPDAVKQMQFIKGKVKDHFKNGFIFYLDTLPVIDEEGQLTGERPTMIYITEFGMDVQIINEINMTLVKPRHGYYTFDLLTRPGSDIHPQIVLFFDTEPSYWYDD